MATSRYRVRFVIREGAAGSHFVEIEPAREDYRTTLGCDALRLHLRDGVDYATLEALIRDLNSVVETLVVREPAAGS